MKHINGRANAQVWHEVHDLIATGALFVVNHSGGKGRRLFLTDIVEDAA